MNRSTTAPIGAGRVTTDDIANALRAIDEHTTGSKGFDGGLIVCLCVLLSLLAVVTAPLRGRTSRELFPHTPDRGRTVVEYEDDAIQCRSGV